MASLEAAGVLQKSTSLSLKASAFSIASLMSDLHQHQQQHHRRRHHSHLHHRRTVRRRCCSRRQDLDDDVKTDVTAPFVASPTSRVAGVYACCWLRGLCPIHTARRD